jgi:hypothetical protein
MTRQGVEFDAAKLFLDQAEKKTRPAQRANGAKPARSQPRKSITMELGADLVDLIRDVADALDCSPAAAVNRLLLDALQRYADGDIGFRDHLEPSRSPRYLWVVKVDQIDDLARAVRNRLKSDRED